ncbi:GNAT family N-acetyltransferase [Nonomuraea ferruginea]
MVRWADAGDLPGLVAVEVAADGLFEQVGITFPPGTTMIEEVRDPSSVLVEGDPPAGFALLARVDGNLHLEQLAVHPDRMRQGIGGRLVEAMLDHARASGAPSGDADDVQGRAVERAVVRAPRIQGLARAVVGGRSCASWCGGSASWASRWLRGWSWGFSSAEGRPHDSTGSISGRRAAAGACRGSG